MKSLPTEGERPLPSGGQTPGESLVEARVRAALTRTTPGADVYANVHWLAPTGPGGPPRDGETDLLVVHPEYGILAIEVKDGPVAREASGHWFAGNRPLPESPFHQAMVGDKRDRGTHRRRSPLGRPPRAADAPCGRVPRHRPGVPGHSFARAGRAPRAGHRPCGPHRRDRHGQGPRPHLPLLVRRRRTGPTVARAGSGHDPGGPGADGPASVATFAATSKPASGRSSPRPSTSWTSSGSCAGSVAPPSRAAPAAARRSWRSRRPGSSALGGLQDALRLLQPAAGAGGRRRARLGPLHRGRDADGHDLPRAVPAPWHGGADAAAKYGDLQVRPRMASCCCRLRGQGDQDPWRSLRVNRHSNGVAIAL